MTAILFLAILVFNFAGYRMVISCMEKSGDAALQQRVDERAYSDEELISVKTKLNLPYYSSSPGFERAYGSVTIKGVVYDYVQRRVFNDTLELRCLPNTAKTKLRVATNELAKSAGEDAASVPVKKGTTTLKISLPDFFQPLQTFASPALLAARTYCVFNERRALSGYAVRRDRPPQAMGCFSA